MKNVTRALSVHGLSRGEWLRGKSLDIALGLFALLSALCLALIPRADALEVEVESTTPGAIQLFFDQGEGFSEALSSTLTYGPGTHVLKFPVPAGENRQIRLDPSPGTSEIVLHRIGSGDGTAAGSVVVPLQNLSEAHEISSIVVSGSSARVSMQERAADPQVLIRLDQPINASNRVATTKDILWQLLLACVIVLALRTLNLPRVSSPYFVVSGITLVLVMALLSPLVPSPHPDEFLHVADARYFDRHWLPPSLSSGALAPSYTNNVYGVSYLYEWNVVYWFAGKAGSLLALAGIEPALAYRAFNVCLMALAALTIVWSRLPKTSLAVLFVTPQLWYVFAYFNGDAFPFAMACVAIALAIPRDGPVQTFISTGGRLPVQAILFAVAMALLLISKKNFLPAAVFASLWLCASCLRLRTTVAIATVAAFGVCVFMAAAGSALQTEFGIRWSIFAIALFSIGALLGARWFYEQCVRGSATRGAVIRFALLHAIAVTVALPWVGADLLQNGSGTSKSQLVTELREQHAAYPFKPSTILHAPEQSQSGLQLATKDVRFSDTLRPPYDWVRGSYRSFFSAYGYMKFFGPGWMYLAFGGALAVLIAIGAVSGLRDGTFGIRHLVLIFGCSAIILGAAALHSWTYDFQPQGRYVFGFIPMLMPLFAAEPKGGIIREMFHAALLVALALSVYSFLSLALANLV